MRHAGAKRPPGRRMGNGGLIREQREGEKSRSASGRKRKGWHDQGSKPWPCRDRKAISQTEAPSRQQRKSMHEGESELRGEEAQGEETRERLEQNSCGIGRRPATRADNRHNAAPRQRTAQPRHADAPKRNRRGTEEWPERT